MGWKERGGDLRGARARTINLPTTQHSMKGHGEVKQGKTMTGHLLEPGRASGDDLRWSRSKPQAGMLLEGDEGGGNPDDPRR